MMNIRDAIDILVERFPDALFVSSCGYISRDLLSNGDRTANFYMVGSMGIAAPLALGLALARPADRIVVLDGDGSMAMNLGVLPVIAQNRPNLIHAVLDNGLHESTGGQRTVPIPDLVGIALAAGYRSALRVDDHGELEQAALTDPGPTLLHIACSPRDYAIGGRLTLTPPQLVARFQTHLGSLTRGGVA
jgi:phosphonopyruvate decarboxylase